MYIAKKFCVTSLHIAYIFYFIPGLCLGNKLTTWGIGVWMLWWLLAELLGWRVALLFQGCDGIGGRAICGSLV